jgi:homocysteine S-methyltransferase
MWHPGTSMSLRAPFAADRALAGTPAPRSIAAVNLSDALARGVVVLDGGLSTALESAGHDLSDELWTARLLLTEPDAIRAAHAAYYEAGAQVVITSSYQATFDGLARRGLTDAETTHLLGASVALARAAASDVDGERWVAASVGPYGAMLADGSEYRGRYGLTVRELEDFHRRRIEVLGEAGPDVLAVETVPDVDEAEAVLRVVAGSGVPTWLSFSVRNGRTCAGQSLETAFGVVAGVDEVIAVGVNCSAPEEVGPAVATAKEVTGLPVVVYPNSGEQWDATARAWAGGTSGFVDSVPDWVAGGARLVGGCCRVGPDGIAELASALGGRRG